MAKEAEGQDWSFEAVRKRLQEKAASGDTVAANVFFRESVSADELPSAAEQAISEAEGRLGHSRGVKVQRIHPRANSVSVQGDPEVIAELMDLEAVKTVLPSEIEDIYPRPIRRG